MKATDSAMPVSQALPRERGLLLRNLAEFQTELARVAAGFVPGMSAWLVRIGWPREIFADFRMVQDLRTRHRELGVMPGEIHLSQAAPARALIEVLCAAPTPAAAFAGITLHVKPRLAVWIEGLLHEARGIYDLPTVPLLEANIELLRRQTAWAREQMPAVGAVDSGFETCLEAALANLGSELARPDRRHVDQVRAGRRIGRLPLLDGVVPDGFALRATLPPRPSDDSPYAARERYYAFNFLQEVQAADSCGAILFEAPDMPWDFYFDAARHMWDETRHSKFGELKLNALGLKVTDVTLSTTAYRLRQTLAPHDRYAALTTQEADAFPGKHQGLKEALENHDAVGAMTWSYDIADETQHVRYGQKWLPALIKAADDPRSPEQVRADAENWRAAVLLATYRPVAVEPASR
ncbi:MAG: hypothetical protein JNL39_04060 [Opitutaceae bacterium]|nr:hypothetical protein [Opitutaceae bacterium]